MVEINDIRAAAERISPYIQRTPLLRAAALDRLCGCQVYLKPESLQGTGSFKLRGATNKLLSLSPGERARGVIAASSGNHAQGVACAASRLDTSALIIMPENAPPPKISGTRSYGAEVELFGRLGSERDARMEELAEQQGRVIVHAYQDPAVIAGQGTAALEILADEPELDYLLTPVGGGGLLCGLAIAAKAVRPQIQVAGIEPAAAARYHTSREQGQPLKIDIQPTIADGTRVDRASAHNFPIIEKLVDTLATVTEEEIRLALYVYAKLAKLIVEPSASLPLAALLARKISCRPQDKVCLLISGGNLDFPSYSTWLAEGETLFQSYSTGRPA